MDDEAKTLLKQVLEGQKKILAGLEADRKRLMEVEERIAHIELNLQTNDPHQFDLSPALIRALKAMFELQCPCTTEELAEHLGLSRNVVSLYLNQLERSGLVSRQPNLGTKRARYLFGVNTERVDDIRDFLIETAG